CMRSCGRSVTMPRRALLYSPAQVLATVRADGLKARGETWSDDDRAEFVEGIRDQYETQGSPYYASARLWDDGVIDPIDTRAVLGRAVAAAMSGPPPGEERYGIFRM
ncbi:MAG TPA: carboxyl transferase domain-containing protein, partial [Povalibacter sp.]|nr:carboxyl transferase domain-containing protein [Povalibacter sp.]